MIHRVDFGDDPFEKVPDLLFILLRCDKFVLRGADHRLNGLRLELLRVDVQFLHNVADNGELVGRIQNGKIRRKPDALDIAPQDPHAHGVEGGHPNVPAIRAADEAGYAVLHLARGLVGKGDRQNGPRRRLAGGDQVGDAVRQHARLAAARAGHDQQRPFRRDDGFPLLRVQTGDRLLYVNRLHRNHAPFLISLQLSNPR
ncbi:hypothetical protein D1872_242080 [compost metagenome]